MTARNGSAEWHGNVASSSGTITVGDGVFEGGYSYESRFREATGANPKQLLAAAHSVRFTLARIELVTEGGVPGIDERQFKAYAEAAKKDCPVPRALAGIPEIVLTARLDPADSTDATAGSER
jgi:osmotically inducible protein OsmC